MNAIAHRIPTIVSAVLVTGMLLVLPAAVQAQDTSWLTNLSGGITGAAEAAVVALTGLAFALFLWGMVVFIANAGNDQKRTEGKKKIIWGILALAVLVSLWGVIQILQKLSGTDAPISPNRPKVSINN